MVYTQVVKTSSVAISTLFLCELLSLHWVNVIVDPVHFKSKIISVIYCINLFANMIKIV